MKHAPATPRLGTYITLGLGAGLLGSAESEAVVNVTFYGPGSQTPPATPDGINIGLNGLDGFANKIFSNYDARFGFGQTKYFTQGSNFTISSWGLGQYSANGAPINGAILNSNQNYGSISFNGDDGVYEAVGQFYFNASGGGYLVAIAKNSDNSALTVSAGKTAIEAVPEPSSIALLSLGAAGVLARRRRMA